MVGFQNDHVNIANPFDDELCGVAKICDVGDGVHGIAEGKADWIAGVMWNAKRFNGEVANFKCAAGGK